MSTIRFCQFASIAHVPKVQWIKGCFIQKRALCAHLPIYPCNDVPKGMSKPLTCNNPVRESMCWMSHCFLRFCRALQKNLLALKVMAFFFSHKVQAVVVFFVVFSKGYAINRDISNNITFYVFSKGLLSKKVLIRYFSRPCRHL